MHEEKPTSFAIVIDKERDHVMNIVFQAAMENGRLMPSLMKAGLGHVWLSIARDFNDRTHQLGWCEDPDCKYEKK